MHHRPSGGDFITSSFASLISIPYPAGDSEIRIEVCAVICSEKKISTKIVIRLMFFVMLGSIEFVLES